MTRNLLYHVCPLGCWRWNIEQLKKRIHLFNGIKIAAVSYGEGLDSIQEAQTVLPEIDEWIFLPNDEELRETATLLPLLELLHDKAEPQSITFYAHTKSVTRGDKPAVRIWTALCYQHLMDRIPEIEKLFELYYTVGVFKTKTRNVFFPKESRWHFSGTFFAFRTDKLFERNWRNVPQMRYGAEGYPGCIWTYDEATAIFASEGLGDLYRLPEARKWAAKSELIFNKLNEKEARPTSGNEDKENMVSKEEGIPS